MLHYHRHHHHHHRRRRRHHQHHNRRRRYQGVLLLYQVTCQLTHSPLVLTLKLVTNYCYKVVNIQSMLHIVL
jgi:hypothetical protein